MASAGFRHTVLLRSGGSAVAVGDNGNGQCNIPPLDEGMAYTHISAGNRHTVLLRSDGSAVAIGDNSDGQCDIPPLDEGIAYNQVSAGHHRTVLLRSNGSAVAIGDHFFGQCYIPRFLQASIIQCFFGVMAVLLPLEMDNVTSHL